MLTKKIPWYNRTKFITIIVLLLSFISTRLFSQEENVDWLSRYWNAYWITMPGKMGKEYGVYHFRKNFTLEEKPGKFIIHISADNRYKLFVNGQPVGYGPAQGTPLNWMYDTYDISPFLKTGGNTIACQVWNYGQYAPWVQMSVKTGFIVQGDSEKEKIVDTDESWKVSEDSAYKVFPIDYTKIPDFIIVSPGDIIDANKYPWNWEDAGYHDETWLPAAKIVKGGPYGTGTDLWWQLVPRKPPYLSEDTIRFRYARRISTHTDFPKGVLSGKENFIVPANSKAKILLDQEYETTAFPEMVTSGGKGAIITLSYAESLMYPDREKGNRNDIEGKELYGLSDRFITDGGSNRHFTPLYFRSYRYLELEIETANEPLAINDFYARYSFVKHPQAATFETSDTLFNHILQTAWHTQDVCTKDYLLTDAYYEQLQYIGDNHIQALILNSMGYSQDLVKNTIWQYYMSRIPEGLTQSRFPCAVLQVIPTYSLLWISMVKEYWSYYKDDAFVKEMLSATNTILDWYEKRLDPATGLTGKTEFFNFVDWTKEWTWVTGKDIGGVPTGVNTGGSSITTMQFAIALNDAAALFNYYHEPYYAEKYKNLAARLTQTVWKKCWDEKKQLLADTPDKTIFSQHANIFGVLSNTIPQPLQKELIQRVAHDTSLIQSSVYFRFFLGQAYKKAGMPDEYLNLMQPWKDMLNEGLTTFAEVPGHARSDCHPWSSSPLYEFFSTVCGINPATPGFGSVEIKPALGKLQWVKATVPHGDESIQIHLDKISGTGIKGEIILPANLQGYFIWNANRILLKGGKNNILVK